MPQPRALSGPLLPPRLADLPKPPRVLYIHGELPRGPGVAIVGTRHPTQAGRDFAQALAYDLARAGVAILSGGALGVDSAAHVGALQAGGATVVVAPAALEYAYPPDNHRLFADVLAAGGAYVSLVSDGKKATRARFFRRNECLVALAHLVVVVEAGFRSGARNTAANARRLGRPLLVVPHSPWSEKGAGCLVELRCGAVFCLGAADVLRELDRLLLRPLPLDGGEVQPFLPFDSPSGLSADLDRVLAAIASGAEHVDQISEVTGISPAEVQRQILTLTLDGVLAPDPSGRLVLMGDPGPPPR